MFEVLDFIPVFMKYTFFAQDIRVFSNFKKYLKKFYIQHYSRSEKYIAQWCEAGDDERKEYVVAWDGAYK